MKEHHQLRVCCKAALYNEDRTKVLLAEYNQGVQDYGLPGGHMEAGETPDETMNRELLEELGLVNVELQHADFLVHHNGKLVLGYVGTINEGTPLVLQEEELSRVVWQPIIDIAAGRVAVASYQQFILNHA